MSLFQRMREDMYKQKNNLPPEMVLDPVRNDKPDPTEEQPKKDWEAPTVYTSIGEFEEDKTNLIDNLSAGNPNIRYGSKKALHNFRDMIRNIGDLYKDYLLAM